METVVRYSQTGLNSVITGRIPAVLGIKNQVRADSGFSKHRHFVSFTADEPDQLLCFVCKESFNHSWYLLMHLSENHHLHVYAQEGESVGYICSWLQFHQFIGLFQNGGTTKVEDVQNELNRTNWWLATHWFGTVPILYITLGFWQFFSYLLIGIGLCCGFYKFTVGKAERGINQQTCTEFSLHRNITIESFTFGSSRN